MEKDRPSTNWNGADKSTPSTAGAITVMFDSLDRPSICAFVSSLRNGISTHVSPQFTNGTQNLVIELCFSDGVVWIARLKIRREGEKHFEESMNDEVRCMKLVRSRTGIPVPEVYAWDGGSQNPFGAPFIVMQAINGRQISRDDPLFQTFKSKILDQMASILIELSTVQYETIESVEFPEVTDSESTGRRPTFDSAREFYSYYLDEDLQTIASIPDHERETQIAENEKCRRLLRQIKLAIGPYPLIHIDFGLFNLLFDDGGNIVGVIDWTSAGVYPWEVFAQYPEPLRIWWPFRAVYPKERWEEIIEDQRYFKDALRKCERERNLPEIASSLISADSKLIAEGILGVGLWPKTQRKGWMEIFDGIELRTTDPSYTPGSITFEEVRKM
jgi:aminoglycoside phosphotransferase (APT) family kinase protein